MTGLEALRDRMSPLPEAEGLIGLSGGADSVALTMLLLPLRESRGLRLCAAHVNHGLRGAESDEDERFVRALCDREGIPLRVARLELGDRRDENAAREARYAAFRRILKEEGLSTLILAHQRDDQAETFLMRLLRGAGPEGLGGMRPLERREDYTLMRPLLDISGAELRQALREAGIPWREDGSNGQDIYLRNRVRQELTPLMERLAPGVAGRIARTAGLIGLENDAMAAEAERLLHACDPRKPSVIALKEAAPALRTRALRLWWRENGPALSERELNYDQTRRLEALLDAPRGSIINLPGGWRARREKDHLRLLEPGDRTKNNRPRREKEEKQ